MKTRDDEWIDQVNQAAAELTGVKSVQKSCAYWINWCDLGAQQLAHYLVNNNNTQVSPAHEFVPWFTWLFNLINLWHDTVLRHLDRTVPYVADSYQFYNRFCGILKIVLQESYKNPLTKLPNVHKVLEVSVARLQKWFVTSEQYIQNLVHVHEQQLHSLVTKESPQAL